MRTALDQALGVPSPAYSAGLAQGQPIKAVHIQELRNRVLSAWTTASTTDVRWLVNDQLGTPRIILDQTGSFAGVSRHDYLPFGEALMAGGRDSSYGYTNADSVRQKFTQKERDNETGLDYFVARYYSSQQGRFVTPDSFAGGGLNPQSLNLYGYVLNIPLKYNDPTGHTAQDPVKPKDGGCAGKGRECDDADDDVVKTNTVQEKNKPIRQYISPWDLPSPLRFVLRFCPTGYCGNGRTLGDDKEAAKSLARISQKLGAMALENTDSIDVNVSMFWVINGGVHYTADGDVFPEFTPPQSGLIELVVDAAKSVILKPVPFSFSVTTTHIFYGNVPPSREARRDFYGGPSISGGGAFPIWRNIGPYYGAVYSPSTRQFGVQTGVGSTQVGGGVSLSPSKPIFTFEHFRWKQPTH